MGEYRILTSQDLRKNKFVKHLKIEKKKKD